MSGTRGRGKDGLWKAWENDKTVFPLFPQPLEIAAAIPTLPPPRLRRAEISLKARQNKNRENDAQYHYPGGPNYMVKVGHAGIANSLSLSRSNTAFQSTPPAWGATSTRSKPPTTAKSFNPRPPRGGRLRLFGMTERADLFQSTPPAWGATTTPRSLFQLFLVSIHAPRVGGDGASTTTH